MHDENRVRELASWIERSRRESGMAASDIDNWRYAELMYRLERELEDAERQNNHIGEEEA